MGLSNANCDSQGQATLLVILAIVTTGAPVMELFSDTGAYLQGHFRLTSGLHSGEYLQCAKVLAWPQHAQDLGERLAQTLQPVLLGRKVDAVVSPAIGGIVIGYEVARALRTLSLFAERDGASREMTLRRGFTLEPGAKTVVIEDVVTTGGSTKEVVQLLQSLDAEVFAAGCIIDRSGGKADTGVPHLALHTMSAATFPPEDCPLCRDGVPVVKPGSRPT